MIRKILLLLVVLSLVGGYVAYERLGQSKTSDLFANKNLPVVQMTLGGQTFTLEVANTETQRQTGLMHRDSMPRNHGMIFVFSSEQPLAFWMKNTRFPLDILYVNADGYIVSTHTMRPHDLNTTPSEGYAKWAIELNKGLVEKLGLKKGDKLEIPPGAQYSPD